ncbi:hypothetical protein [Alteromonas gracilis]
MKKTKIASALLLAATAGFAAAQEVPSSKNVELNASVDFVAA